MKVNKAANEVGLVVELFQHASNSFLQELLRLCNHALHTGDVPTSWRKTVFFPPAGLRRPRLLRARLHAAQRQPARPRGLCEVEDAVELRSLALGRVGRCRPGRPKRRACHRLLHGDREHSPPAQRPGRGGRGMHHGRRALSADANKVANQLLCSSVKMLAKFVKANDLLPMFGCCTKLLLAWFWVGLNLSWMHINLRSNMDSGRDAALKSTHFFRALIDSKYRDGQHIGGQHSSLGD